jgi:hypothetical protein
MTKAITSILIISLLIATSCRKSNTAATLQGGTWTFNAATYNATSCVAAPASAAINASGRSSANTFTLSFNFLNGYPTSSGNYTVINGHNTSTLPFSNLVMINATISGASSASYYSSGSGTGSVSVDVVNGKLSLSGTGIEMLNTANTSDSSALSFNITQTQ